ncbi:MAG: (2Fe-2S)-binding protein [Actinomycetota bacterium]|nr:(2Fe-2S)-binding protein [Actinomycetota bacterium]MDQ3681034.1 (2Fe-2S)-binding protein [Actinomycetota bacterium]
MVVCHCRVVTDRAVCAAIRDGARDVGALAECSGAGSVCGGCWPALESLLASGPHSDTRGMVDA